MSNIGSYDERVKNFSWSIAEKELGYKPGDVINIGWYCTDRICDQGKADRVALYWEGFTGVEKTYTYNDIRLASNTIADFLRGLGIKPGERVCLFLDRIPELYLGFLGILKTGAIAQPLFSAFGDESLLVRLSNAETTAVITQKKHAPKVRKILDKMPHLRHIIVVDHDGVAPLKDREVAFSLEKAAPVEHFDVHPTLAESPSVLHYTSGTTGMPKGVQHVHYSLISQYLTAKWALDLRDDDIYWCTADPGWVTGTSYGIIAPFALGVTQCVLDAGFSAEAWYKWIEKRKVTMWYSAPTAIRSLMKAGDEIIKKFDLSSLRHLASVGEPLNSEAVVWSQKVFGKPFYDTYWQTETGSIVIGNYPDMEVRPGSMGKPFPGITGTVLDPVKNEPYATHGKIGLVALKFDWPSRMRTYWNNEEAFKKKFRNDWYITGDRSKLDARRLLLVRRPRRRHHQHGRPPRQPVRGRIGPARAPRRGRIGRGVQARPDQPRGRQGLCRAQAGLHGQQGPRPRDHELHPQEALAPGHAPGDRVRAVPPQDAERQDHAPPSPRQGMGRGDRRHVHSRK